MSYVYAYETFNPFVGLDPRVCNGGGGQPLYLLVWSGNKARVFDEMFLA